MLCSRANDVPSSGGLGQSGQAGKPWQVFRKPDRLEVVSNVPGLDNLGLCGLGLNNTVWIPRRGFMSRR
mgnify:CR=1 FL=1